jgi:hypothetical protein
MKYEEIYRLWSLSLTAHCLLYLEGRRKEYLGSTKVPPGNKIKLKITLAVGLATLASPRLDAMRALR